MAYLDNFLICLPYILVILTYAGLILLRIIRKFRELNYLWNELIIFGSYIVIAFLLPLMMFLPLWSGLIQLGSIALLLIIPFIELIRIRRWTAAAEFEKIDERDYEQFIIRFPEEYTSEIFDGNCITF